METHPTRGSVRYEDKGQAERLKLKSTSITDVTVSADLREATIDGNSVDFQVEVKDVPRAPDTVRIRLESGYDSGTQTIKRGDIDIECGD